MLSRMLGGSRASDRSERDTRDLSRDDLGEARRDTWEWAPDTVAGDSVTAPQVGVGDVIGGHYRVIRPIGEGGMGVVLHGVDERLQRDVAIKLINPQRIANERVREQFLEEARAMARVHHPNVVEIHAFGEIEGTPYFVMEHVAGTDLESWLRKRTRPLAIDEAIGIIDQVCRGVHAIHEAGAVHGDIKPGNILVGPDFRVVVTDFGLARPVAGASPNETKFIAGTPAYMAPELASPTEVPRTLRPAADVYALGVLAFELLTGELPFHGEDTAELLRFHAKKPPPPPTEIRPDLPETFDRTLLQALAKRPTQRIRDAETLRKALAIARDAAGRGKHAVRILVADDDEGCRQATKDFLEYSFPNAEIECVVDGRAALESAKREPPSVAIIDLSMPGLNGVELTAAMREDPTTKDVPILVITGEGGAPDWRLLHSLGANGFLVKPVDGLALTTLVRKNIEAR